MNWEAIGAVGEVVGAAGVIITLAYLASQIRQNNRSQRLAASSSLEHDVTQIRLALATDPDLLRILKTGLREPAALSETEVARFSMICVLFFQVASFAFENERDGFHYWSSMGYVLSSYSGQPGFRQWWSEWGGRRAFSPEFAAEVERHLSSPGRPHWMRPPDSSEEKTGQAQG